MYNWLIKSSQGKIHFKKKFYSCTPLPWPKNSGNFIPYLTATSKKQQITRLASSNYL